MVPEQQPDEGGQRVGVTEEETNQRDNEFKIRSLTQDQRANKSHAGL